MVDNSKPIGPWEETLSCKNHKCLSRCHRGSCYHCQTTVDLKCNCGSTKQVVPCGRERNTRPPRCKKPCGVASNCHHPVRDRHNCHPAPCPTCKQVCEASLPSTMSHVRYSKRLQGCPPDTVESTGNPVEDSRLLFKGDTVQFRK